MATVLLLVLAVVLMIQYQRGTLRQWLRSKLFNAEDPLHLSPAQAVARDYDQGAGSDPWGDIFTGATWRVPIAGGSVQGASAKFGACRPIGGCSRRHEGVDFGAPTGTPVQAARRGRVTYAGSRGGYGLLVELDHGDGWTSRYAHLSLMRVRVGDSVNAGATVGHVGATGNATGPHLHFETRFLGVARDPEKVIASLSREEVVR